MAEKSGRRVQLDRGVEQAIVALKRGAHLLKCGRRGKYEFCSFRLSSDEKSLIWYSREKEKCLELNTVSKVILGQKTVNFLRQLQSGRESQSFSVIYKNSERSLDLICKDTEQAECWVLGLTALLSISHNLRPLATPRTNRVAARSCMNSPVSHLSTKNTLKLMRDSAQLPQVYCVYKSPPRKLVEKYVSDGQLGTSDVFYSLRPKTLSNVKHLIDEKLPFISHTISEGFKSTKDCHQRKEQTLVSHEQSDSLKDVFMWGEGVGVFFGNRSNLFEVNGIKCDVLLPKLLESTKMLDIESISCGEKHAALVTRQGEVFCWGEGSGGKLGHKVSLDLTYPKAIESLSGSCVKGIACGSTQTYAVTHSGELYTWGKGCHCEQSNRSHWIPQRISSLLGEIKISKVACGEWHTAIVSSFGILFTYGEGTFGALGHGDLQSLSQPKEVESLSGLRVKSVACGPWHTAAIIMVSCFKSNTSRGKLFTWGDGDKGRLGHCDKERKFLPTRITSLEDYDFVQVSCGRMLTVALTVTGLVITMGSVMNRRLINSPVDDTSITTVEGQLKDQYVKELSSGSFHVAVLTTKGNVYTWGKGKNGRLGLGDTNDRDSPSLVEALQYRDVLSVACGFNFTTAICQHKSISGKDQSLCTRCRMAFGFTRKKHNCYNCGYVFCHSCSSKRALNTTLAPNKNRKCRVCNQCYTHLENLTVPRVFNEIGIQREYSITGKDIFDVRINRDEALVFLPKIFTPKSSIRNKSVLLDGEIMSMQSAGQQNKDSLLSGGAQKWGQVSCPLQFKAGMRKKSIMFVAKSKEGVSDDACANGEHQSKSLKQELPEMDKLLTKELQRLHAKAKALSQQCQSKSTKIQQYKSKIEETCLLARDEAAKCKAAKSVIKGLRTQVNALSETIIAEEHEKETIFLAEEKLRKAYLTLSKD
ncbi:Ultraviolet-B receptor UVR8 [Platanthera guangdongensis]|uniref:Ultraviolet-B receptor UVR8 n=1 Tax=Platanthera guangdongensis TaxID=2320717 RepID=A0ABR2M3I2_9ASPA